MTKKDTNKPKKELPNSSVLLALYNNKLLSSKVDEALDEGKTYDYIIQLCESYKFDISKGSLTRYKEKRREAMETGLDLEDILDKRRKTGNVVDIKSKERKASEPTMYEDVFSKDKIIINDIEVLDTIIAKAAKALEFTDAIEAPLAIRAIEAKAKITQNQLGGVSLVGLKEMKLRSMAKESAMTEIILKYIKEDLQEEVINEMERVEQEFYDNLDLTDEGRRISSALKQLGGDRL